MPKKQIDYTNTHIYKICCLDIMIKETFIGHTTNLTKMKYSHKRNATQNTKESFSYLYQFIKSNGGWENWDMVLIEKIECKNSLEAKKRTRFWIENLQAKLNKKNPCLSEEEILQKQKREERKQKEIELQKEKEINLQQEKEMKLQQEKERKKLQLKLEKERKIKYEEILNEYYKNKNPILKKQEDELLLAIDKNKKEWEEKKLQTIKEGKEWKEEMEYVYEFRNLLLIDKYNEWDKKKYNDKPEMSSVYLTIKKNPIN